MPEPDWSLKRSCLRIGPLGISSESSDDEFIAIPGNCWSYPSVEQVWTMVGYNSLYIDPDGGADCRAHFRSVCVMGWI